MPARGAAGQARAAQPPGRMRWTAVSFRPSMIEGASDTARRPVTMTAIGIDLGIDELHGIALD